MIDSLHAGSEESPEKTNLYQGRTHKAYRENRLALGDRSRQRLRLFPVAGEDGSGRHGEHGPAQGLGTYQMPQITGGQRAGMGSAGYASIDDIRTKSRFLRITAAALKESHAHDVIITKEAPNYWIER